MSAQNKVPRPQVENFTPANQRKMKHQSVFGRLTNIAQANVPQPTVRLPSQPAIRQGPILVVVYSDKTVLREIEHRKFTRFSQVAFDKLPSIASIIGSRANRAHQPSGHISGEPAAAAVVDELPEINEHTACIRQGKTTLRLKKYPEFYHQPSTTAIKFVLGWMDRASAFSDTAAMPQCLPDNYLTMPFADLVDHYAAMLYLGIRQFGKTRTIRTTLKNLVTVTAPTVHQLVEVHNRLPIRYLDPKVWNPQDDVVRRIITSYFEHSASETYRENEFTAITQYVDVTDENLVRRFVEVQDSRHWREFKKAGLRRQRQRIAGG